MQNTTTTQGLPVSTICHNLFEICTFKSVSKFPVATPFKAFNIVGEQLCQLNPPNWTTGFKYILEDYNGPLVIFVKDQKHEDYGKALNTHSRWCQTTTNNILFRRVSLTWYDEYTIKEGLSEQKGINCFIEGNLFCVLGDFPDIQINLVELFGNTLVQVHENKNLVMIGIFYFLMQKIGNHIQLLKNDLLKKEKKNQNVAYIFSSKMNSYLRKRCDNLTELSKMIFQGKEFLTLIEDHLENLEVDKNSTFMAPISKDVRSNFDQKIRECSLTLLCLENNLAEAHEKLHKCLKIIPYAVGCLLATMCISKVVEMIVHKVAGKTEHSFEGLTIAFISEVIVCLLYVIIYFWYNGGRLRLGITFPSCKLDMSKFRVAPKQEDISDGPSVP